MVVGRKVNFVDPSPEGLSKVTGFLSRNVVGLSLGVVGVVVVVAGVVGWL